MGLSKEQVVSALRMVHDPEAGEDLVSLDAVRRVAVCDDHVGITVSLATPGAAARDAARERIVECVKEIASQVGETEPVVGVEFVVSAGGLGTGAKPASPGGGRDARDGGQKSAPRIDGVETVIAVGAGKGGVGKSTISVNLAVSLARGGKSVGLLDGDIYGPSAPTMMGLGSMEPNVVGKMLQPFYVHGVKCMTIGKLVDPERPLIWRGPMAHGAFKQLIEQTQWGELDYLIIDLPPGTGDVCLTLAQTIALDGAVIVCTPQKVAQDDAVRAARMFQQLDIDVLGVVENMSYFIGDDGKEYDLFGRGGAERMAQRLGLAYLGQVPINTALRENSDSGDPSANFEDAQLERAFGAMREIVEKQVMVRAGRSTGPTLTVR
ncbi:MAG: P-loop NTPase [Phycisphaerales bacterium JB043]